MAGIDMVGIPYKGGGQLITDLIGGQIQVGIAGTTPFIPHHRAGRIKILALTSLERFPPLPEIPAWLLDSGPVREEPRCECGCDRPWSDIATEADPGSDGRVVPFPAAGTGTGTPGAGGGGSGGTGTPDVDARPAGFSRGLRA